METKYTIHPAIGIARLGNSPEDFYLAPENPAQRPQECDDHGNAKFEEDGITPKLVKTFKDAEGRIKRQGARFQIFVTDADHPEGRPLKIGDHIEGGGNRGTLIDIQWRVHLANKKSSWYEFAQLEGEQGYTGDHKRRNAHVTGSQRDRLITDPGPRVVSLKSNRKASFDRSGGGIFAPTFPPKNTYPTQIDTLGEMVATDAANLVVLGGFGNSGSELTGPGEPKIENYANNDGWYDDVADGPVMARLVMYSEQVGRARFVDVEYPAWVMTGYPRYVPEILDIVTLDDAVEDMFIREMAYDTSIYGKPGSFDDPQKVDSGNQTEIRLWKGQRLEWNPDFYPMFYRDVWPILFRPNEFNFLTNILSQSNYPHSQETRGTFSEEVLSQPPSYCQPAEMAKAPQLSPAMAAHLGAFAKIPPKLQEHLEDGRELCDPNLPIRQFLFQLLRLPSEEDLFKESGKINSRLHNLPLMPLLCGDNPISNTLTAKFLRLTEHQLFILRQWADGKFINEHLSIPNPPKEYNPYRPYPTAQPKTTKALDKGVLSNILGGAFCPGGEIGWIMRNPSIYREPYRIKADPQFSTFRQTAAQASAQSGNIAPEDYSAYLSAGLSQDNHFDAGLQPGDLTKYMSVPWQADFNECSSQTIDVTHEAWNRINAEGDSRLADEQQNWDTLWWPAHRPMQTYVLTGPTTVSSWTENWAKGIPQTNAGDLKMVTEWPTLGFVVRNPLQSADKLDVSDPPQEKYVSTERS